MGLLIVTIITLYFTYRIIKWAYNIRGPFQLILACEKEGLSDHDEVEKILTEHQQAVSDKILELQRNPEYDSYSEYKYMAVAVRMIKNELNDDDTSL